MTKADIADAIFEKVGLPKNEAQDIIKFSLYYETDFYRG